MSRLSRVITAAGFMASLVACGGRPPQPVMVVQPQDVSSDCMALLAEIQSAQVRIQELHVEQNSKSMQNVGVAVVGALVAWPLLFALDFQGTEGTESTALQSRVTYLTQRATQKRCEL